MLEFRDWSFKGIWFGAFQMAYGLFGHLLFGFRFQERSAFIYWPWGLISWFRWSWIMIRYAGCFGIMMDFFKQPRALVQIEAISSFWTFWVHLIFSADSVYRCAFVLFWLEIRLITIFTIYFWKSTRGFGVFPVPLCDYKITRESELFKTECSPNADIRFCGEHRISPRRTIWALTWKADYDMITVLGRIFPAPFLLAAPAGRRDSQYPVRIRRRLRRNGNTLPRIPRK